MFYVIYKSVDGYDLIVSPSFRGVQEEFRKISQDNAGQVAWDIALPHLCSKHNIFRTRASHKTFSKRIYTLDYDEMILFSKESIQILKRPKPNFHGKTYKELVEIGIDKSIDNIKAFMESDLPVKINLSGGKDSRMLLALILRSGFHKNVVVNTDNPKNLSPGPTKEILSKDFLIAGYLAEKYGMKWGDNEKILVENLSFEEFMSNWQDFRSNNSFEVKKGFNISGPLVGQSIYFSGIGGELIRSYVGAINRTNYPDWWSKCGKEKASIHEDLSDFFKMVFPKREMDSKLYESSRKAFVNSFSFSEAEDVIECFDLSYINYRSRAHAGVGMFNNSMNKIISYPICQQEFYHASKLLERNDQEDGKVIFDVMHEIAPFLVELEFASPPWPKRFFGETNQSIKLIYDVQNEKVNEYLEKDIYDTEKDSIKEPDFIKSARSRVKENLKKIFKKMKEDSIDINGVITNAAICLNFSESTLLSMLGVTESLMDVICPQDDITTTTFNFCLNTRKWHNYKSHSKSFFQSNGLTEAENEYFENEFEGHNFNKVFATFEVNVEQRHSILKLMNIERQSEIEVAVYWYLNGEKINVDWYQEKFIFENSFFQTIRDKDVVRATVFLKKKGCPDASRVFNVGAEFV